MKTLKQLLRLSLLLIFTLQLSHCSKDDTVMPENKNPEAESINAFFDAIPIWDNTEEASLPF